MSKKASKKAVPAKVASNGAQKITLLVKDNPKRAGSDSHKRFALYTKNKTVEAFLKAGGTQADLGWDTKHKFIKVSA